MWYSACMRIVLVVVCAALLGGGSVFAWWYFGGFGHEQGTSIAFVNAYSTYTEIAAQLEELVYVPGVEANVARQELLVLLNAILTETMEPTEREVLARTAFARVDTVKKEIDAARGMQDKLYQALQDLDNAGRQFRGERYRVRAHAVTERARDRAECSSRITSLLADMNDHAYAIVTKIIADHGALTAEHVTSINEKTDEAQQRFDTLTSLYTELGRLRAETEHALKEFTDTTLS